MRASKSGHPLLPVFSLLFTATLWGIVWYPLRLLEEQGLAGLWSTLASYGAALCALLWMFLGKAEILRRHARPMLWLSLAAGWCNVAFIMAILEGNVVRVLLLFYLSPFWAVCLGWLMLGERLTRQSLLILFLALIGALTMLWDPAIGVPWPQNSADWLAVSSGFTFALSNVYVRQLQEVSVWLKSVSTWLGVVLIAGGWIVLSQTAIPEVSHGVWLGAVALGLLGFLMMTVTVQYGVSHMPLHRSAVILLFELVVGAVSSLLLTDEVVLLREWLGGGLIIVAAYLAASSQPS